MASGQCINDSEVSVHENESNTSILEPAHIHILHQFLAHVRGLSRIDLMLTNKIGKSAEEKVDASFVKRATDSIKQQLTDPIDDIGENEGYLLNIAQSIQTSGATAFVSNHNFLEAVKDMVISYAESRVKPEIQPFGSRKCYCRCLFILLEILNTTSMNALRKAMNDSISMQLIQTLSLIIEDEVDIIAQVIAYHHS